jgi:hypothetical protein
MIKILTLKKLELKQIIREEIAKVINPSKKLVSEGYAWERTPGKPLPTLKDVQEAHDTKNIRKNSRLYRRDGLLNRKSWANVTTSISDIVRDLSNEGFELDEITDYLAEKLEETIYDSM